MKWKMIETTANIRRMWIKKAVTWNTKKPPSHSRSKTNPRTRNIVILLTTYRCLMHFVPETRLTTCRPTGKWPQYRVLLRGGGLNYRRRPVLRKVRCPRKTKRCLGVQIECAKRNRHRPKRSDGQQPNRKSAPNTRCGSLRHDWKFRGHGGSRENVPSYPNGG
jgi:hypothetical protein